MPRSKIYDEPSTVYAEPGEVIVDGPDGVAVSITPGAAMQTGQRLIDGAAEAAGKAILATARSATAQKRDSA